MTFGTPGRHRAARPPSTRGRRPLAALTVVSLGLLGAVVLPGVAVAAPGDPGITVAKEAPSSILAGDTVSFTLTVANPSSNASAQPEYNTSLRDVLPAGVTYRAGSTTPSDIGDPLVITDGDGRQTLIWRDAFDLQIGASSGLTFVADVDNTVLPVASTIRNTGDAYASTAPRYVPRFDATGAPVASANVQSATSTETATGVSALRISKAEPSPESKLLRGVHDRTTVYTVTLTNTSRAATDATSVVDYLPAQLEFLGCGQVDNSSAVEYAGAPRLTATPAVPADCPTPVSVDTVANPPADGAVSYPAGVYTKVTWDLGTLAAGQTVTIRYAAGVPLRRNALFAGGPSAGSLGQVANLDNNTGGSTRQDGDAAEQTNHVHAAGTYTGPVLEGGSADVVADSSHTVTVHDLRVHKSVAPSAFVAGAVATYTLHVDSGEYTDNAAITITDVLPNGTCPLDDVANHVTGAPGECDPAGGVAPSLAYRSVTQNADGTFTVVFDPIAVAKDGSTTITYRGRNRPVYTGGPLAGTATSAGDSFTNRASESGTSTPLPATGFTGPLTVRDSTSATQTTSFGSLEKTVGAREDPMDCASATYGTTNPVFADGDRVCFQVSIPFSTTNQTRNPVVTDFLPENTVYEAGSVTYPAANTVDPAQISFDTAAAATGALSWTLGATQADGTRKVAVGAVFVARFSVLVTDAAAGPAPDKPGNIVKLRTTNSAGVARSLRAGVDFRIAAAPPVGITKGVASVNGSPAPVNPANTDHVRVREGDSVVFRVDATNNGSAATSNALPITSLVVWDVLPAGIECAQISAISDAGACTDPADAGQPSFAGNDTRSAIVWPGDPAPGGALAAGATRTLTYTMTVPTGTGVSTVLGNTAAVRSYDVPTDDTATTTHFPAANVDTSVPAADYDAPAASDVSDVYLPDVAVTKGVTSQIDEPGNIGGESSPRTRTRAVVGEQVTFTVSATVPRHTTVFLGRFADPVPAGLALVGATAAYRPDSGSATTAALPAGVVFSAAAPPTITFPTTYTNATGTDQVFTMTIVAAVTRSGANVQGTVRTNTASFVSYTTAAGDTAVPTRSATAIVGVVEPSPSLTKTDDAAAGVSGGQDVTFTLTASNAAGRPPLHDAWQLDCVPSGLTFAAYGSPPGGVTTTTPVAGDGTNGCAAGYTVLAWNLGDLAGGTAVVLTYSVTVDTTSAGLTSLVNTARLSGSGLAGTRTSPVDPGNPAGRDHSAAATDAVTVAGAAAGKSVTPGSAVVGETVTYTTSAVLPAGVHFYNLSLIDTLPRGIDPASVALVSTTCTNADTSACTPASATALTPSAGAASATVIGWLLGDSGSVAQVRTVTVTYTARVADVAEASAGAGLVNRMHASWDVTATTPPTSSGATYDRSGNEATATVTVLEPGPRIVKSVTRAHPEPGQSFTYSLTVTNPSTPTAARAHNVTVTDVVPTGVVVGTITGGGTISGNDPSTGGGTISWTLPVSIAVGAPATVLSYDATLAPSATLSTAGLTNTARITGYDSLATGGRHYTGPSDTAVVAPYFPSLTTAKSTPGGTTAFVGEPFAWRVRVTNSGSGAAYEVGAVDTLPAHWTYDAGSAVVSVNGSAPAQVDPDVSTSDGVRTLTWTSLGTLPAGTVLTIDYTATPGTGVLAVPGVGLAVDQTNRVRASAQDATGATGNGSGSYGSAPASAVAHIASADLALVKTVGTAPTAGQGGSWLVTVTNTGPDTATGPFVVTDDFTDPTPGGVSNVHAGGTGWSCTDAAPISCTRPGTLAKNVALPPVTITYDVAASVDDGRTLTNTATVRSRSADPDTTDNTDTADTTVATSADVAIDKTVSSTELVAGAPVSYALAVSNAGPSSAAGPITVTDTVPAGTTFVSVAGTGWTCDAPTAGAAAGTSLTCTRPGPLTVGATPPALIVTVAVLASRTGDVVNTASVTSTTTDPDPGNNSDTVTTAPVVRADVAIQKTHLTTPFVAGEPVEYRLDVTNNGPSDAAGVRVSDTLPAGLDYVSFASDDDNWDCTAAGQEITCDRTGTLAPGTSVLTITVDTADDLNVSRAIVNTATVTTTTTDPVPANNTDDDDSTVTAEADLSIVKTDSGTTAAGDGLTYHLAVHNDGPSAVPGTITVSDPLPAGLTFDSARGTGWDCGYATATRLITCTLAAGLGDGDDAAVIDVVTTVNSDVGASTITNTASVQSDTPDPDVTNNSDDDAVEITTEAAVSLTKVLTTDAPVVAGTDADFTLVASNEGPSDAVDVSVIDHLPQYLTYVSSAGAGWSCAATGQDVVCTRAAIVAGTSAPDLVITAHVSPSTPVSLPSGTATLVNTASIDSVTPGPDTDPDPVDVPVRAQADLTLVKTAAEPTVVAGGQLTWQLAVHDDGPSDAAGPLTLTDTLPGFQTFVSAAAPWTCTAGDAPETPGPDAHQIVTCTLADGLALGGDAPELDIVTQVDRSAPAGPVTNSATVSSPTPGADGTDEGTVEVTRTATLTITKTHPGNGRVGEDLAFTLGVHNDGPSVADQVVVTDALPEGLDYVSATGTGWTCEQADRTVTCALAGTLAPGEDAATITVSTTVRAAAYPTVTNTAVVGSEDPDLPGTSTAEDPVVVDPSATLQVTKEHVGTFVVGDEGTYRLSVSNTGPTPTPGPVELTDGLPVGLTYVDATGDGWTCGAADEVLSCEYAGGLAVGATTLVTLTVLVGADAYPAVTNAVTVTAPGSPPATDDDTAPVTPTSSVSITKQVSPVRDDGTVTYAITVTDDGPSATVDPVVVTDPLPDGLRFESATGEGWRCADADGAVTCTYAGSLDVGSTATITLLATVTADPGEQIVNVAFVQDGLGVDSASASNPAKVVVPGAGVDGADAGPADTGADLRTPLALAGLLLLLGLVLVVVFRRRVR